MPTANFVCKLSLLSRGGSGTIVTNLKPFQIEVLRGAVGPGTLPYAATGEGPPGAPNVWFQLWTLGENEPRHWTGAPNVRPHPAPNELSVEIPGYLQETAQGFEFRAMGAPHKGTGQQLGWISLSLIDANGKPRMQEGREPRIPIVSAGQDDEVDVVCALLPSAGTATVPKNSPVFSFTNLTHIIGSQLREGGLLLGFHVSIPGATSADDLAFPGFGEMGAQRSHALGLRNGELVVASSEFTEPQREAQILDTMAKVRDKVHREFLHGQGEVPKINRFFTATHGSDNAGVNGIQVGKGVPGWLRYKDPRFDKFMDGLAQHLTPDAVWAQCSCSIGHAPGNAADAFGNLGADRKAVGTGSFSDECRRALAKRGVTDVAIWGHVMAGNSFFNATLRAFTKDGNMDVCYLAHGLGRRVTASEWLLHLCYNSAELTWRKIGWDLFDLSLRHPGKMVQQRLAGSGATGPTR